MNAKHVAEHIHEWLHAAGIHRTRDLVLVELCRTGGRTPGQLNAALGYQSLNSTSEMLNTLEGEGLIARVHQHFADRRLVLVVPTPEGLARVRAMRETLITKIATTITT
jgi:DNA-binding MarR family transcriptional regulator